MVRKALDDDFSFDVFCHYYGVNNYDKYSNKEIAEKFNMTLTQAQNMNKKSMRLCEKYFYFKRYRLNDFI